MYRAIAHLQGRSTDWRKMDMRLDASCANTAKGGFFRFEWKDLD